MRYKVLCWDFFRHLSSGISLGLRSASTRQRASQNGNRMVQMKIWNSGTHEKVVFLFLLKSRFFLDSWRSNSPLIPNALRDFAIREKPARIVRANLWPQATPGSALR